MKFAKCFVAFSLATSMWVSAIATLSFTLLALGSVQSVRAQATPVKCEATAVSFTAPGTGIFAGTADYMLEPNDKLTIKLTGQPGDRVRVSIAGLLLADGTIGVSGMFNQMVTISSAITGKFGFDVTSNSGLSINTNITCTPASNQSGDINQAIAQIDGTLPVTNPETQDGDVFSLFLTGPRSLPEETRFPEAAEEQILTPADNAPVQVTDNQTSDSRESTCQECQDAERLRQELSQLKSKKAKTAETSSELGSRLLKLVLAKPKADEILADLEREAEARETAFEILGLRENITDLEEKLRSAKEKVKETEKTLLELPTVPGLSDSELRDSVRVHTEALITQEQSVADLQTEINNTPFKIRELEAQIGVENGGDVLKVAEDGRKNIKDLEERLNNSLQDAGVSANIDDTDALESVKSTKKRIDALKNFLEAEVQALQATLKEIDADIKEKEAALNSAILECENKCPKNIQQSQSDTILPSREFAERVSPDSQTSAGFALARSTSVESSYGFNVSGEGRHAKARFDLREWRKGRAARDASYAARLNRSHALGIADNLIDDPKFNLFASASVSFGDNDARGVGQKSTAYSASGGFSYLVRPDLNLGLAARFGEAAINSNVSDIDATTWGIAAFAEAQLETKLGKLKLDAIAAWSRSDIDSVFNNSGVITTSDAIVTAFSAQVKASTQIKLDSVTLGPNVSVTHVETDRDAFALSDGQVAPGVGNNIWLYNLGTSVSFAPFQFADLSLTPGLNLGIAGRIDESSDVNVSTGGSLGINGRNGTKASLSIGYSGLGGDTRNLTFSGSLTFPLN